MSRSSIAHEAIADYATAHSMPADEIQQSLIAATTEATGAFAMMQIGVDQGAFMSILTATLRPRFAVEIGTFTGYSSICIARGLAEGGRLLCCDVSEEWTAIAREHWEMAGLSDRIDLEIGPALDTLAALPADPPIDLAFIDADKPNYHLYVEAILERLAPQGLILIDNTLWSGNILPDSGVDDDNTTALRALNDQLVADPRLDVAQLTIGDGVTMVRRRD